jgi:hypothetical protein
MPPDGMTHHLYVSGQTVRRVPARCPMDRAAFSAVDVGGTCSLCLLVVLNNVPLAACAGVLAGLLAVLRGLAVWG